jgi:uracil-DNA glycosylase
MNEPKGEKPPGRNRAACKKRSWERLDGIASIPVLALGGYDSQTQLLADRPRENPRKECGCQPVALSSS